jgi:hypothetical protein
MPSKEEIARMLSLQATQGVGSNEVVIGPIHDIQGGSASTANQLSRLGVPVIKKEVAINHPCEKLARQWVQCGTCHVWRRMANGTKVWKGGFNCSMNSWDEFNACGVPQEDLGTSESDEDIIDPMNEHASVNVVTQQKRERASPKKLDPAHTPKRKQMKTQKKRKKKLLRKWVQCEQCHVWRTLASGTKQWNGQFECAMNTWNEFNRCGKVQENLGSDESDDEEISKQPTILPSPHTPNPLDVYGREVYEDLPGLTTASTPGLSTAAHNPEKATAVGGATQITPDKTIAPARATLQQKARVLTELLDLDLGNLLGF